MLEVNLAEGSAVLLQLDLSLHGARKFTARFKDRGQPGAREVMLVVLPLCQIHLHGALFGFKNHSDWCTHWAT